MENKEQETTVYPDMIIECEDCDRTFAGQIGPLTPGINYPLVEHMYRNKKRNDLLHDLMNHHYTERKEGGGHNKFNVISEEKLVGKISASTNAQMFTAYQEPKEIEK